MRTLRTLLVLATLVPTAAFAQVSMGSGSGRWFYGGGLGLTFGDVTSVNVRPLLGYRLTDQLAVGGSLIYRYRDDDRFNRDLTTHDYGASAFARYTITGPFFVQAELEQLSYEVYRSNFTTDRRNATSLFAGGGISQPISRNVNAFALVMYNLSHSSQSSPTPYSSPWLFSFGVGIG
ncbi:MAG: hypothetical protein KIT73_08810, partial [Burkholderiales bacterium]|nr:hypothetical protein [Burkholderiales bacterium]